MLLSSLSPVGLILTLIFLCIIVYIFVRNIKRELGIYGCKASNNDAQTPGIEDETELIMAAAAYYYLNRDEDK